MKKDALKKISALISPEAEEPVYALFETIFGYGPSVYVDAETGKVTATIYIEPKAWNDGLLQKIKAGFADLRSAEFGCEKIKVQDLRREDWAESWKRHFKPIEIGNVLLIKPSWNRRRPKKNQQVIILDPGLSFGTGQHATTSFCLKQLTKCRSAAEGQSFLDIGTGSGILAIAAAKLGYKPVEAFDFDPDAVRIAQENATNNKVNAQITRKDLTKLPAKNKSRFDVVCANLTYDLLVQEADRILNRLKPSGNLVLAGILKSQFPLVKAAYEKRGLKLVASKLEKEWQSGRFIFREK